jgi:hypothetical protein
MIHWLNNVPITMPTNTDNKAIRKSFMSPPPAYGMELPVKPTVQAPCQAGMMKQMVMFLAT